jgi:uncharacterized membrane protein YfcA
VNTDILPILIAGAVVAGFIQGLSGFAFSMLAMSFWVWGLEPRVAAVMAVFGSLVGQLVGVFSVRRALRMVDLWPFLAGGVLGIPLGVGVLPHLNADLFKLVLGVMLVIVCPLMLIAAQLPKVSAGDRLADGLAGLSGGFMGGIGGFTGVIPTLWCTIRGMEKEQQRSVIQNFNLATLAATMIAYVATGVVTKDMLPIMPIVAVSLLIPSLIGARIYVGLSELAFRRIVLGLLSLSGLAMLVSALLRFLK